MRIIGRPMKNIKLPVFFIVILYVFYDFQFLELKVEESY